MAGREGTVFLTETPWIAWRYAELRTAASIVHENGDNRGLVVTVELELDRLERIPHTPPPDHVHCIGFADGWWADGSIRPDEIVAEEFREFEAMRDWRGVWDVYRHSQPAKKVNGRFRGWNYAFAKLAHYWQWHDGRTDLTDREREALEAFAKFAAEDAAARRLAGAAFGPRRSVSGV